MIWTEDHLAIRRTLEKVIDQEINPFVDAWEESGMFPAHEVFGKLGKLGLLGLTKPVEYGGAGLDYSYGVLMAETTGRIACGGVPMAIGVQTDMATPALARFGSDDLRSEFLAPSISGDYVACLGVSEPGAGSDVASIRTSARKDGGDYVISGGKLWTTNGAQADWMCALVNTGDGAAHKNKSLVCIPMKAKGVTVARTLKKIGMNASDTAQIHFDEVRIPQRFRIGAEGQGFAYQMMQFQEERLFAAANGLVMMERAIEETIAYARERKIFGKPVLDNQVVHFTLAELQTEIEALRALVYRATDMYVRGQDVTTLASMAKLKSGRLLREVGDKCLQYWGGMGFMWENRVARLYRDGRLTSIGGGADEVMLQIISKKMGTFPKAGG
ncbi:MAG: acyl-CoA dehydrogenase family protein [Caulobacterales bacterium]|jgi:citronellyl-CoA dehydrogenase